MVLKQTQINGYHISTIWRNSVSLETDKAIVEITNLAEALGFDISEFKHRRDWLAEEGDYETRVFRGDGGGETTDWTELDSCRSKTEEQALQDHDRIVEKWSTR